MANAEISNEEKNQFADFLERSVMALQPNFPKLRRPIFPRRKFQERVIASLRAASPSKVALSADDIAKLVGEDTTGDVRRDLDEAGKAILELERQRILLCDGNWTIGGECRINPRAIFGESADERLARLPDWPEPSVWMSRCGAVLLTIGAVLFFIFTASICRSLGSVR